MAKQQSATESYRKDAKRDPETVRAYYAKIDADRAAGVEPWWIRDAREREESRSEQQAENAWLRHAERPDPEAQEDLRLHDELHPYGYGRTREDAIAETARYNAPTEKQIAFLARLIDERGSDAHRSIDLDTLDKWQASKLIDELTKMPRPIHFVTAADITPAPMPAVPDGRYAVERGDWKSSVAAGALAFYRVRRDSRGTVRVSAQASDTLYEIRDVATARAILTAILAADPRAAAERYGRELGKCGCCGRLLTDAASRANGLGPDCVEHFGQMGGAL